jgi:hypothetical protein
MSEAVPIAAEHWAFCNTFIDDGNGERLDVSDVRDITPRVLNNPLWGFWWD